MRSVTIERRPVPPRWFTVAVPIVAVLCAALLAAGFLAVGGYDPIDVYRTMLETAFGSRFAITETLVQATPLILTGLAAALAFRLQLWNIGGEGQLYLGAVVSSGLAFALGDSLPAAPAIGLLLIAGAVGGGLYALLAGVPRAVWGTDEIVLTLMFNFVALNLINYLVFGSSHPPPSRTEPEVTYGVWPGTAPFGGWASRRREPLARPMQPPAQRLPLHQQSSNRCGTQQRRDHDGAPSRRR